MSKKLNPKGIASSRNYKKGVPLPEVAIDELRKDLIKPSTYAAMLEAGTLNDGTEYLIVRVEYKN